MLETSRVGIAPIVASPRVIRKALNALRRPGAGSAWREMTQCVDALLGGRGAAFRGIDNNLA